MKNFMKLVGAIMVARIAMAAGGVIMDSFEEHVVREATKRAVREINEKRTKRRTRIGF